MGDVLETFLLCDIERQRRSRIVIVAVPIHYSRTYMYAHRIEEGWHYQEL